MSYEDRISIATPEGVELDVTLAGLGSRFVAALVDQLIQWAVMLAMLLLGVVVFGGDALTGEDGETGVILFWAALVLVFFLIQFGYHVLFETRAGGRTPGKRWTGLRVVRLGGGPVTFTASAIRNLVRIVDALPGAYAVGIIALLSSSRNQRLGDMAAGTLVIRERMGDTVKAAPWMRVEVRSEPSEDARTWDASAVTAEEAATVRRFLERRATLTDEARARLAAELALRLRPKVVGPRDDTHPEDFLLDLAAVKATRG